MFVFLYYSNNRFEFFNESTVCVNVFYSVHFIMNVSRNGHCLKYQLCTHPRSPPADKHSCSGVGLFGHDLS